VTAGARLLSDVMSRRPWLLAAWAILSPLLLVAANTDWLYTPAGYLDPWDYVGFFLSYDQPEFLPGRYKLARLPWILSGWLAHAWLPDTVAPLVLHLAYLLLSVGGMYVLVAQLFGSRIGALTAVLLAFYTPFHGSGGWDYHNTAAGAFHLWSLVALTHAARVRTLPSMLGAGCLVALAVHTNITLVNLIPLFAVHLYVVGRQQAPITLRTAVMSTLQVACGGLAVTAALMAINVLMGRDPQFFRTLVAIVLRYTADPSNFAAWWKPWGPWVLEAKYLAIPAATLVVTAAAVLFRGRQLPTLQRLAFGEYLALAVLWCIWQSRGRTALDWEYFAYPLIPQAFLAVAALLHWRSAVPQPWLVGVSPILLAAALIGDVAAAAQPWLASHPSLVGMVPALVLCILAAGALQLPRRMAVTAFVLLWSVGNGLAAAVPANYAIGKPCQTAEAFQAAVIGAHRFVAETDPAFEDATVWFEENEQLPVGGNCQVNLGYLGYALAASGVPYITEPFPLPAIEDIPAAALDEVTRPRRTLVVVTARPENVERVTQRLEEAGIAVSRDRQRAFQIAGGTFAVHMLALDRPSTPLTH
jgi:hypothetical protein